MRDFWRAEVSAQRQDVVNFNMAVPGAALTLAAVGEPWPDFPLSQINQLNLPNFRLID